MTLMRGHAWLMLRYVILYETLNYDMYGPNMKSSI